MIDTEIHWLLRAADERLAAANRLIETMPRHAAFWYIEAAVNYLKYFLVKRNAEFSNSRAGVPELGSLLKNCGTLDSDFTRIAGSQEFNQLNSWELAFQYPPEPGHPKALAPSPLELDCARRTCEQLRERVIGA